MYVVCGVTISIFAQKTSCATRPWHLGKVDWCWVDTQASPFSPFISFCFLVFFKEDPSFLFAFGEDRTSLFVAERETRDYDGDMHLLGSLTVTTFSYWLGFVGNAAMGLF